MFTMLGSGHNVLEQDRSNGVMTLMFKGQLISKNKNIQSKKHIYTENNFKITHKGQTHFSIVYLMSTNVVYQMNVWLS